MGQSLADGTGMLESVRRYLSVYRAFFVSSLVREMEFRANFFAKLLANLSFVGFFVLIVLAVYARVDNVAGWSRGDAMILTGTMLIVTGVNGAISWSLVEIPQMVRQGTLDFVITRPIDSQFWVSTRRFHLDHLGSLTVGILMVCVAGFTGEVPDAIQWFGYLALLPCAMVLLYSINFALMTTGIWFVRVDNLWVLSDVVTQVARFPLDIYASGVRAFLTFYFPLAVLATLPTRQLKDGFDPAMVALGAGWAVALFVFARWFWRFAMSRYSSASS